MKTINHIDFLNISLKENAFFNTLYKDVSTFKEYLRRIDSISNSCIFYGYKDKQHMIGDLFEIFAEQFIHILGSYPTIGITDYRPVKKSEDNGVDGKGIGHNGFPLTVQVKYRRNPMYELVEDDIKQFATQSYMLFNVDVNTKTNLVVFTSCAGLHWHTATNVFDNRLRVINYKEIATLVDNNMCFWNDVNNMVEESKNKLGL